MKPPIYLSTHPSIQATVMLTCLVATNPHARAHILSKVGNINGSFTTQGSIQASTCQGSKGTSQGLFQGPPCITTLSQSINQDRIIQESNPTANQRVNQCSTGIIPGSSEKFSMASTIVQSVKSSTTNQGLSPTTCHRLNNVGSKKEEVNNIATISQSVKIKLNQRSTPRSKEGSNLETIQE